MFKLKNPRRTWWNETDYIIPQFDLEEKLDAPGAANTWLGKLTTSVLCL